MRDPAGRVQWLPRHMLRQLASPIGETHFLRSELARRWVRRGDLTPFEVCDEYRVVADRIPFVTQPSEWSDLQLYRAAELTLRLQGEAVDAGFDMKDASAWNIIFDGTQPLFCDLLSFEPLQRRKWWAAGQFSRHFILPLLLAQRRGLHTCEAFQLWRDGVPPEAAKALIGRARFLTRYWPLMSSGRADSVRPGDVDISSDMQATARFRISLHGALKWMLDGVEPRSARITNSQWQDYVSQRPHYSRGDLELKREVISQWLQQCAVGSVIDLGCNSGEFTRLAVQQGASVIAVDADHGAIQSLFSQGGKGVYPVLASLDDLRAGRGWAGAEHAGLPERLAGQGELVMMLALIHHLAIACSIPMPEIAAWAARLSSRWLIVEMLSSSDVQVHALCKQRARNPAEFDLDMQLAAFSGAGWEPWASVELGGGSRRLCLMERRP